MPDVLAFGGGASGNATGDEASPSCESGAGAPVVLPVGGRGAFVPRLLAFVVPQPQPAIPPGPPASTGLYPVPTRPVFRPWLAFGPAQYVEPLPGPPPPRRPPPVEEELLPPPLLHDPDAPAAAPASAVISLTIDTGSAALPGMQRAVRREAPASDAELQAPAVGQRETAAQPPPLAPSREEVVQPARRDWRWRRTRPSSEPSAGNPLR